MPGAATAAAAERLNRQPGTDKIVGAAGKSAHATEKTGRRSGSGWLGPFVLTQCGKAVPALRMGGDLGLLFDIRPASRPNGR